MFRFKQLLVAATLILFCVSTFVHGCEDGVDNVIEIHDILPGMTFLWESRFCGFPDSGTDFSFLHIPGGDEHHSHWFGALVLDGEAILQIRFPASAFRSETR